MPEQLTMFLGKKDSASYVLQGLNITSLEINKKHSKKLLMSNSIAHLGQDSTQPKNLTANPTS